VSHNMAAVQGLCSRALLLSNGHLELNDSVDSAVRSYLSKSNHLQNPKQPWNYLHRGRLLNVTSVDVLINGQISDNVQSGDHVVIRITYAKLTTEKINSGLSVSIIMFADENKLTNLWTNYFGGMVFDLEQSGTIECEIPKWMYR